MPHNTAQAFSVQAFFSFSLGIRHRTGTRIREDEEDGVAWNGV
jgi:hypothetical protein